MSCINSLQRIRLYITLSVMGCMQLSVLMAQNNQVFFTGDNTDETEFNRISKSAQRATRDLENLPPAFSLKQYAPVPGNQGKHGTCVAWSTAYGARTISYCLQRRITDKEQIKSSAFSPNYLYYYIKMNGDTNCIKGAKIEPALKVLTDKGNTLLKENIPDCIGSMDVASDQKAKDYIIKAYTSLTNTFGRITKNELITIKKSIAENKPVIFSVKCFKSLTRTGKDGIWNIEPNDEFIGNHAICIVGYDDNKLDGAFEVMNSWGTEWGNNGFFWITYEQIKQYGSYALEMMDREVYEVNASRGLTPPQIKGSIDFVLTNDFGNEVGAMQVLRTTTEEFAAVESDNSKAVFSNYKLVENYQAGQRFKIKFTTNAPAFVYIFSIDDKQVVSTLFPYAGNISAAINSTNATVYLPSETKNYKLNDDANRERICILYSKSPLDFDLLKGKISAAPSGYYQEILSLYNNRIIPVKKIDFKNDKISFGSLAAEQELICFFVDLHRK